MISTGKKIVAIASSTGGPRALQELIPLLPSNLDAPVTLVQHMPAGFTKALGERLNLVAPLDCQEAKEGDMLYPGHLYLAMGGMHMKIIKSPSGHCVHYSDEPHREGVKPCANYMYESLADSSYDEIICVVLTGMGADGTAGIKALKETKKTTILVQNEETSTVFGMPKSVIKAGLCEKSYSLQGLAREIIKNVGVY